MVREIYLIAALSNNKVIGKVGEIPWYLPDDFKYFAKTTTGHTVVMGRKTYESIFKRLGKPLPNRQNVILTSQKDFVAPDCLVCHSVQEILDKTDSNKPLFIIGGEKSYKEFLPLANKLFLTKVNLDCDGDTFFPEYNQSEWREISSIYHPKDEKHTVDFAFKVFTRK